MSFLFDVSFVGGSGSFFSLCMFLFLVMLGFLSHHVFGKRLLTRFIICVICLLTLLHVVTSFPWYIVGGGWDLTVSVPDCCPLQYAIPKLEYVEGLVHRYIFVISKNSLTTGH